MKKVVVIGCIVMLLGCKDNTQEIMDAQGIVDSSIETSGGKLYRTSFISFDFRDRTYVQEYDGEQRILKRISKTDSSVVMDVRSRKDFKRFRNDSLVSLPDSLANKYSNSINSVHYFAYLPYGLNDPAVHKELLGNAVIKDKAYYKIKVTFDEEGGGDDFDDIYIYWFNKETLKPDYLAYKFHVDGGGQRFREAINERYVSGIRFVDYNNYKPRDRKTSIYTIDSLFDRGDLELMPTIELQHITVRPDSYN